METTQAIANPAELASSERNKKGICDYVIYRKGENVLFVPCETMLLAHEESTERAVARRAGLKRTVVSHWRVRNPDMPWLMDYLYNADLPEDVLVKAVAERNRKAWLLFRKESQVESIVRAVRLRVSQEANARRKLGLGKGGLTKNLESSRVRAWLRSWRKEHASKYPEFDFPKWLLRGQDPPPNVTVATRLMIRRCTLAWDYVAHCEQAGFGFEHYLRSLRKGLIPDLRWLNWLYGARGPAGVFVVTRDLQKLRSETTQATLFWYARTNDKCVAAWKNAPHLKVALDDAIQAANGGTLEKEIPESLKNLGRTAEAMTKYALAQTLEARCQRAGISVAKYEEALRDAESSGARAELDAYLKSEPPYEQTAARTPEKRLPQHGLVRPNFFIPTKAMLAFREVASKEWSRQGIPRIGNHPAFDQWLLDWTTPTARCGRIAYERMQTAAEAAHEPNGHRSQYAGELRVGKVVADEFVVMSQSAPRGENNELGEDDEQAQSPQQNGKARRRPGRPLDTDPLEDKRIADAWKTDQYRRYADLARELGKSNQAVADAIERERKRSERRRRGLEE